MYKKSSSTNKKQSNILFIPVGGVDRASSRFRVWEMIPYLEEEGYKCKAITYVKNIGNKNLLGSIKRKFTSRYVSEKEIRSNLDWADIIIIQESLLSKNLLMTIKNLNKKIIFDFSDPINMMHLNPRLSLLNRIKNYLFEYPKFLRTIKMANSVIVENELLLKTIKRHDCDCYVMRGPIDSVNFIPKYDKTTDAINIGWTGSPATFPKIESLLPIIDDLGSLNKIKLILIGCGKINPKLNNIDLIIKSWSVQTEREIIPTFDIGLFNLEDLEFDKFRGGGKLFVYMASGVPFITPNIGIGKQVYDESKAGKLVKYNNDWKNSLLNMIKDNKYREELSIKAREYAVQNYSHKAHVKTWLKILGTF